MMDIQTETLKTGLSFITASIIGLSLVIFGIGINIITELRQIKNQLTCSKNNYKEGNKSEE